MTERKGGSDVAFGTETYAVQDDDQYRLYGYKWFTSATDANVALTLARVINQDGSYKEGTKGLALFYVEVKNMSGSLNNIQIVKLKNKLGTRQVPTAELLLDGTRAYKISEDGCGVSAISNMLCLTRIHNASSSVGLMRSILRLARDYSQQRHAFGKKIGKFPLHMQTLSRMEMEVRGAILLLFKVVVYLGKAECKTATDEEILLLRLLTPVLKLYTAKQAVSVISEGLEAFGGQGYIEDTGLPVMLRDAQVLPIWEGTTNILSLDVMRSIAKTEGEDLKAFMNYIEICVTAAKHNAILSKSAEYALESARSVLNFFHSHPDQLSTAARDFAYSIARTFIGASLLKEACCESSTEMDVVVAKRWCEQKNLCPVKKHEEASSYSCEGIKNDYLLVMEGYPV